MEWPSMGSGWKLGAGSEGILARSGIPLAEGLGRTAGPASLTPGCGGWAPGSSGRQVWGGPELTADSSGYACFPSGSEMCGQ